MISIGNETKVRDIPEPSLKIELESLIKSVMMDFGITLTQEQFAHTVNRLTYLISKKYKGLLLGEVKYVLEETSEHLKGKLSVSTILQLFSKYYEEKVERQRHEMDELDLDNLKNAFNCADSPLGSAIAHKIDLMQTGQLTIKDWDKVPLKSIADKIQSGEIKFIRSKPKNRKYKWND